MKKILILGAGPSAIITKADAVYAANAAISWYKNEIDHIPIKVAVVSSYSLLPILRADKDEVGGHFQKRFEDLRYSPCDLLIAVHADEFNEGIDSLIQSGYEGEVKKLTFRECREMQELISKQRGAIISIEHFHAIKSIKQKFALGFDFIKQIYRMRILGIENVDPIFRPSTGILALLCAIDRHGKNAEYYISGVSFNDRKKYANGDFSLNYSNSKISIPQHIFVDKKIFLSLSKKYRIKILG